MEVNISTKLKFGNILFGYLRQVGCLIEMTANSGLTVVQMGVVKGSRQGALFKAKDVDSRQGLLAKRNKLAAHNI